MEQLDIELGPSAATVYQHPAPITAGKVNIDNLLAGQSVVLYVDGLWW